MLVWTAVALVASVVTLVSWYIIYCTLLSKRRQRSHRSAAAALPAKLSEITKILKVCRRRQRPSLPAELSGITNISKEGMDSFMIAQPHNIEELTEHDALIYSNTSGKRIESSDQSVELDTPDPERVLHPAQEKHLNAMGSLADEETRFEMFGSIPVVNRTAHSVARLIPDRSQSRLSYVPEEVDPQRSDSTDSERFQTPQQGSSDFGLIPLSPPSGEAQLLTPITQNALVANLPRDHLLRFQDLTQQSFSSWPSHSIFEARATQKEVLPESQIQNVQNTHAVRTLMPQQFRTNTAPLRIFTLSPPEMALLSPGLTSPPLCSESPQWNYQSSGIYRSRQNDCMSGNEWYSPASICSPATPPGFFQQNYCLPIETLPAGTSMSQPGLSELSSWSPSSLWTVADLRSSRKPPSRSSHLVIHNQTNEFNFQTL